MLHVTYRQCAALQALARLDVQPHRLGANRNHIVDIGRRITSKRT